MVTQVLTRRYIDKQKLAAFWRTHQDFKGQVCTMEVRRRLLISLHLKLIHRLSDKGRLLRD
jgi:hypothetical protein